MREAVDRDWEVDRRVDSDKSEFKIEFKEEVGMI